MRSATLLPVLDVLNGRVVHAVAGRDRAYQPLRSVLTASTDPVAVARAVAAHLGADEFYVADLNALEGGEPQWAVLQALVSAGLQLWIDAGAADAARVRQLLALGAAHAIIASESLTKPEALHELVAEIGAAKLVFSLDLLNGRLFRGPAAWRDLEPSLLAGCAVGLGIRRLIVLDLAAVGAGGGAATLNLCRAIRLAHPECELNSGGGVRGQADVDALASAGVSRVLVSTALHRGVPL